MPEQRPTGVSQFCSELAEGVGFVAAAPKADWVAIPAEDLLVMTLAPDAEGKPRQVVIQLMPAPFSQGWVHNIRLFARAKWYDGGLGQPGAGQLRHPVGRSQLRQPGSDGKAQAAARGAEGDGGGGVYHARLRRNRTRFGLGRKVSL